MTLVKRCLIFAACIGLLAAIFSSNFAMAESKALSEPSIITEDMVGEGNITTEHVGYYAVSTVEELLWWRDAVSAGGSDASILLMNDISLNAGLLSSKITIDESGEPNTKVGATVLVWAPVPYFGGTIDGGGHAINGLYIKSEADNSGLISVLSDGGVVKNLTLNDSYVYSTGNATGTIAGESYGKISNVSISSDSVSLGEYTGAVCGKNHGEITKCSSHGNVFGVNHVGGISGSNDGSISYCYTNQDDRFYYLVGDRGVGGIVGQNGGEVSYCYSVSSINGYGYGICGSEEYGSKFVGCYYIFGDEDSFEGTDKKSAESFASGEVCYLLNRDGEEFFQTIGVGYPGFSGERVFLSAEYDCPGSEPRNGRYTNELESVIIYPDHRYEHSCQENCDFCGHERNDSEMHTYVYDCGGECTLCGKISEPQHKYEYACSECCEYCKESREVVHSFDSDCDAVCNVCDTVRESAPHQYESCIDDKCDACGFVRDASGHTYDNACDYECNVCGDTREVQHKYTYPCTVECEICGEEREAEDHRYTNSCDSECDYCGALREAGHTYIGDCDDSCESCDETRAEVSPHTYEKSCDSVCSICGEERDAEHTYTNLCDSSCNICGELREVEGHTSTYPCDEACAICGTEIDGVEHSYDNACDDSCNVCDFERAADDHVYTSDCDGVCNECGSEREIFGHEYTNPCDSSCDKCGETRSDLEHAYENECDDTCNICKHVREVPDHEFDEYFIVLEPTATEDGIKSRECLICGLRESVYISNVEENDNSILIILLIVLGAVSVIIISIFVGIKIYGKHRLRRYRH